MQLKWVVLALLLCAPVLAQRPEVAQGTYARNGALIGLANLAPLRDCTVQSMDGKVKSVKEKGGVVVFELKMKHEKMSFQFQLSRLDYPERSAYERKLIRKPIRLRASGYACRQGFPLEAISIDRVY
ncbi:MAG TPA: hypothetical protein VEV84_06865 [Pyrinomonadaceae bacterium]|nr:hypothetical protein [Pyrinomonadaceae bacterium]